MHDETGTTFRCPGAIITQNTDLSQCGPDRMEVYYSKHGEKSELNGKVLTSLLAAGEALVARMGRSSTARAAIPNFMVNQFTSTSPDAVHQISKEVFFFRVSPFTRHSSNSEKLSPDLTNVSVSQQRFTSSDWKG